jgi:hypothetical protein
MRISFDNLIERDKAAFVAIYDKASKTTWAFDLAGAISRAEQAIKANDTLSAFEIAPDGNGGYSLTIATANQSFTRNMPAADASTDGIMAKELFQLLSSLQIKNIEQAQGGMYTVRRVDGSSFAIDMSSKADKVWMAASGNLAGLNASGNLTDSGIRAADIVTHAGLNATSNTDTDFQTGDEPNDYLANTLQTIWNKIRSVANWAISYFMPKFSSAGILSGTDSVSGRPALVLWNVFAPNQVLSIDADQYSEGEYVDIAVFCNHENSLIGTYISVSSLSGNTHIAIGCVGYDLKAHRVRMVMRLFKKETLYPFATWWAINISGMT